MWKKVVKIFVIGILYLFLLFFIINSSPSIFHILSLALFVMTIGASLDARKTFLRVFLKYLIYFIYTIYSLYTLGIFDLLMGITTVSLRDWYQILYGILSPLSLFVLGKIVMNFKFKGHKLFNYWVIWLIYLIVGLIWEFFYPADVIFEWIFAYWILSFLVVFYYKNKIRPKKFEEVYIINDE